MNKLWFIVMETHGDGRLENGDGHERGSIKEELECCRERNSVISPNLSMRSLILLFFAHLSMHHILIRVYYVLGTVTGTLDKAINKTWFLTMEKIKMRNQEERLTQK